MALFTPDLYRNFAIGFVGGALIVAAATADQWADEISPPAQAAEQLHAPQPSDDFWMLAE
ncbi:hypothetical protein [Erythrobacter sp. THAF29]|uniref:hypothetical protein n=1 Tax=Erythrobacter sp. THAF29 TaxID=2587851 RepID=UPI00126933CE|nr:hypothetical protein [Erythrobacter sp. THAF29]QFT76479.1 hypothetical protein FIU90_02875 [Erythrobacter sp. THAF29]